MPMYPRYFYPYNYVVYLPYYHLGNRYPLPFYKFANDLLPPSVPPQPTSVPYATPMSVPPAQSQTDEEKKKLSDRKDEQVTSKPHLPPPTPPTNESPIIAKIRRIWKWMNENPVKTFGIGVGAMSTGYTLYSILKHLRGGK